MTLQTQIDQDFISAMKIKETEKVSVLRMLKSALKNKEIELKRILKNEEVGQVAAKEVKQRNDSISEFTKGNRPELAKKEEAEIKILEKYLPKQLSKKEIEKMIDAAIAKTGASTASDTGKIMSQIMPKVKGKADGFLVSKIVREKLR